MKEEGWLYVGRVTRGHNAIATVEPLAGSRQGADWTEVSDTYKSFPPRGLAELRGAFVADLHDGDLIVFLTAPQTVRQSRVTVRAVAPRRLATLFQGEGGVETQRRLLVETGLDLGRPGLLAVRAGPSEVVLVSMARSDDGRLRASGKNLKVLPLRPFDPGRVLRLPADDSSYYDTEQLGQAVGTVNWAGDDQYLASLAQVLENGQDLGEAVDVIGRTLRGRVDQLTGKLSLLAGADPSILAEVARSEALASRIRAEGEVAGSILKLVTANPAVQALLDERVDARVAADIPLLIASERTRVEAEVRAEWSARRAAIEAELAGLESEGLDQLRRKLEAAVAEVDASVRAARDAEAGRVEAEMEAIRAESRAEMVELDQALEARVERAQVLDRLAAEVGERIASMGSQEAALSAELEALERSKADLVRARDGLRPIGPPRLEVRPGERVLHLADLGDEARRLGVLTDGGVDALLRLAVFLAAGEVPVLHGSDAGELVDLAGALLAGNRVAVLEADPTVITLDDLWSRPGGSGSTALAAAARWAMVGGVPRTLGVVTYGERSGARFWYPALSRSSRHGMLPDALMFCVCVADVEAEEATTLLEQPFVIEAERVFRIGSAIAAYAAAEALRKNAASLGRTVSSDRATDVVAMLSRCENGLRPSDARRLARVHAAACEAFGDGADATTDAVARALGTRASGSGRHDVETPHVLRHAANA